MQARTRNRVAASLSAWKKLRGDGQDTYPVFVELDGSRIEAVLPPVAEAPAFAIRKRASQVIPLERYLSEGVLAPSEADVLRAAVRERWNVVISGGPGSGKTTFAKRLAVQLRVLGYTPFALGLDDYFVNREDTPRGPDGDYDYESLEAIQLDLFNLALRHDPGNIDKFCSAMETVSPYASRIAPARGRTRRPTSFMTA